MEKIKIAPGRVDITPLSSSDNAEPEITGGYIVKKDKNSAGDVSFSTNRGTRLIYDDPTGQDLTEAQRRWIVDYLSAFESALYGANFRDPVGGYATFIDVDSFIDHHIIVEMTKNIDGFRISTFMYKDRNGKLCMGPVWGLQSVPGQRELSQRLDFLRLVQRPAWQWRLSLVAPAV